VNMPKRLSYQREFIQSKLIALSCRWPVKR
jgi:hypothetical protein